MAPSQLVDIFFQYLKQISNKMQHGDTEQHITYITTSFGSWCPKFNGRCCPNHRGLAAQIPSNKKDSWIDVFFNVKKQELENKGSSSEVPISSGSNRGALFQRHDFGAVQVSTYNENCIIKDSSKKLSSWPKVGENIWVGNHKWWQYSARIDTFISFRRKFHYTRLAHNGS